MSGFASCPDENQIAAFAEGRLEEETRSRISLHVADCARCLEQVAFLKGAGDLEARVPEQLLSKARRLPQRGRGSHRFRFAAVAAAAVLAFVFGPRLWPVREGDTGHREVRGGDALSELVVQAPRQGEVVAIANLAFRWVAVEGAFEYTATVLTDGGDRVFEQRTERTEIGLPAQVELAPGPSYFFWVRAHLRDGRTVRSHAVEFSVAGPS